MQSSRIVLIALSLGVAGCAAYGGATLLEVTTDVVAPNSGVVLKGPDVIATMEGTRFHGSVCRKRPVMSPTRIRVERVGAAGEILASAARPVSGLGGRGPRCSVYDVPTDWRIAPDERVRVCALRTDTPCRPPA